MPDWALAISGLIGVILGVVITEFRYWREWREKYQAMTFERRLVTHQEAFNLCCKLGDALDRDNLSDIGPVAVEMRQWWGNHCLFLDRTSSRDFIHLADEAYFMVDEGVLEMGSRCSKLVAQTTRDIVQGIGGKHLPEMNIKARAGGARNTNK